MTDDMASFEFWTEEDDSALELELMPDWHPSRFVDVFRTGLQNFNESMEAIARGGFVTPESVETWGDFTAAREVANSTLKISMTALWGIDAPDVSPCTQSTCLAPPRGSIRASCRDRWQRGGNVSRNRGTSLLIEARSRLPRFRA
ncbi:hypothetical protein [Microbacterium sp. NPDC087589]|uniref:hypothetical protein n=1 Tax=Microbacterium sp. NPDC087589 TaxID=3364191 RepID=UPI0037F1FF65